MINIAEILNQTTKTTEKPAAKTPVIKVVPKQAVVVKKLTGGTFGNRYQVPGYTLPGTTTAVVDPKSKTSVTFNSLEECERNCTAYNCWIRKIV